MVGTARLLLAEASIPSTPSEAYLTQEHTRGVKLHTRVTNSKGVLHNLPGTKLGWDVCEVLVDAWRRPKWNQGRQLDSTDSRGYPPDSDMCNHW